MKEFPFPIILGSKSPRRQELLQLANIPFEIKTKEVDESYPKSINEQTVAEYLAIKKANAFKAIIDKEVVITADTVVLLGNKILGKPKDEKEAYNMLKSLSDKSHQVVTGVCIISKNNQVSFSDKTYVSFTKMGDEEINDYIERFKPFDKAGAYGIQEGIGLTHIEKIEGSYFNVVGLPVDKVYRTLGTFKY